jgi:hypothetical protein
MVMRFVLALWLVLAPTLALAQATPGQQHITPLNGSEQMPLTYPCTVSCYTTTQDLKNFTALNSPVIVVSGTSYPLSFTDQSGEVLYFTSSPGDVTLTVTQDSLTSLQIGAAIILVQGSGGSVTVTPGDGVTINTFSGAHTTAGQFASGSLLQTSANTWLLSGTLTQP